jgi:putative acetyltransferase
MLRLETGSLLYSAHKVYARHEFMICGPFGDYKEAEFSIFMEKSL